MSSDAPLDRLDAPGGRAIIWQGKTHILPDPTEMGWREVVRRLENPALVVGEMGLTDLPGWKAKRVGAGWADAFDLGSAQEAGRLCYILQRYWQALEYDFASKLPGENLGELWRSRQWRKLLNLIDHLPQNTYYAAEVSTDIDHAVMLLKAQQRAKSEGKAGKAPSMATYSPEVERLDKVIDKLSELAYITAKANQGNPKKPDPQQRPASAMEIARLRVRREQHDMLRSRLLPQEFADAE